MLQNLWDTDTLSRLYYTEGKTLADIGEIYHVSRERVRQVMERAGLKRIRNRPRQHPSPLKFTSIEQYISNSTNRKQDCYKTLIRFFDKTSCSQCGSKCNLRTHCKHHPMRTEDDIEVLCASCLSLNRIGKISRQERLEIYSKYVGGQATKSLAIEYDVSRILIYKIIRVVKEDLHSYGDIQHKKYLPQLIDL